MTVRAPRQARSAASLERMLAAAEAVLRTRSFDEVTLAEIARQAGVTVGAFYGRFSGKEALLRHLEERLYADVEALGAAQGGAIARSQAPLGTLVFDLLTASLAFYREHRGTLRALVLRSWSDAGLRARMDQTNRRVMAALVPDLLAHRDLIRHPDPASALPFAVVLVGTMMREAILFRVEWLHGAGWSDARFAGELTRAFLAYLGVDEDGATWTQGGE